MRLKPYDTSQNLLLPINLAEQLVSGTFEHTLNYLVDHEIDTSIFHEHYNNEQTGRLAYDPAMLLKVVLFAYSRGITSSRKIEKACRENVVFMALSADSQPHFTTIADFISRMHRPVGELFLQILMVCDQLDLIGKDMFAIDGRKIMGWFAPPNRLQRAILVSTSKTATDRTTHVYFSPRYRYWQEQFSSFR